ncbi:NALCN channel auxiliary factor 1 [Tachysurus ichikawai]
MTRGARTCRQQHDGLNIRSAPRQDEKPSADSERAQRWRLRLASFLFASVLLADRLWLCAAAERTSAEGERRDAVPFRDTGDQEYRSSHGTTDYTQPFAGNSSTPLWRLEACHPDSVSKSCFTVANAEAACSGLSDAEWNLSDLYLSFCDSYSLLDLFYGFSSPDNVSCSHNMSACSRCVRAFQRLDRLAQDRYHEFELLVQKYETDAYSVRTCMDECTMLILVYAEIRPSFAIAHHGL